MTDGVATAVSVVVVTYQSAPHVRNCLHSVATAARALAEPVEIVVVDNGSTDNTVAIARNVASSAIVVEGHGNIGFGAACNLGAARAGSRYVLFLNPDAMLRPSALQALLDAARAHPQAGLLGARTLRPDGGVELTCASGRMTLWSLFCFASGLSSLLRGQRIFDPESLGGWQRDTDREVPMLSGAALMTTRQAWERLGGFDERFFMYAEDADLCARAWAAGFRPRLVARAEAVHVVGASSASGEKQVLLHRGKATYLRLRWRPPARQLGLACLIVGVGMRARLAGAVSVGGHARRRTEPSAWAFAWQRRREWTQGW